MFTRSVLALIGMTLATAAAAGAESAPPGKVRIGTYDTRAVALAYMRSEAWQKEFSPLLEELNNAKAAGDEKRVKEARPKFERAQSRAHAQVFSNAPIDNIVPKFKDALPAIAKQVNVVVVVAAADWKGDSTELVDVTDLIAEQFKPTDQTRKLMAEIRRSRPMNLVEAVMMKD